MNKQTNETEPAFSTEPDKHVKETVKYDFNDSELTELAREQAQKLRDRANLEAEKKRVVKQYAGRIETLDGEIEAMTDNITSGYEMRQVECAVFYDEPKKGYKSIIRTDNMKLVREERMTEMERQVNLDLKEGEEEAEPESEEKDLESEAPKALTVKSGFKLMEKEVPAHNKRVMFRTKDGEEFIGHAEPDEWEADNTVIVRDGDETTIIPLSVVIAWRELTDAEKTTGPDAKEEGADK